MIAIRKATPADYNQIWNILKDVIAGGDTIAFSPDSSREKMLGFWCGADKHTYVAIIDGEVVGTLFIKDNQPDLGSHIANAGYLTLPSARGKGVGLAMGEFSLVEAKRLGYQAMQFNIVVKSNQGAVRLWEKLGFKIIGEIPEAFNHLQLGMTNAYIMYQKL
ncbi:GNAT family N-acetyltransferase [Pararhodonellum marinum]|uniref:GNAT family N-acetyltransferase n=1 Tax=Pararhodonellum marinum TaxID=2755358 RepID=UPI0018903C2C|nr:GNAT family N-acetyltransferase [Pararhodonellum marinum]